MKPSETTFSDQAGRQPPVENIHISVLRLSSDFDEALYKLKQYPYHHLEMESDDTGRLHSVAYFFLKIRAKPGTR